MNDLMIDIETLSTHSDASILAIGAVKFDLNTGKIDNLPFFARVDRASCRNFGLREDEDTISWWWRQDPKLIDEILDPSGEDTVALPEALTELSEYIGHKGINVWCNGANFDEPILKNAYFKTGIPTPWQYRNVRCYRTLAYLGLLAGNAEAPGPNNLMAHHPVHDCLWQIQYAVKHWTMLRNPIVYAYA